LQKKSQGKEEEFLAVLTTMMKINEQTLIFPYFFLNFEINISPFFEVRNNKCILKNRSISSSRQNLKLHLLRFSPETQSLHRFPLKTEEKIFE